MNKVSAVSTKHMRIWVGLISSITLLVASVANADTEDATGSGTTVFWGEDAPERYGLQDLTHSYNFLNRDDWVDNPNPIHPESKFVGERGGVMLLGRGTAAENEAALSRMDVPELPDPRG